MKDTSLEKLLDRSGNDAGQTQFRQDESNESAGGEAEDDRLHLARRAPAQPLKFRHVLEFFGKMLAKDYVRQFVTKPDDVRDTRRAGFARGREDVHERRHRKTMLPGLKQAATIFITTKCLKHADRGDEISDGGGADVLDSFLNG